VGQGPQKVDHGGNFFMVPRRVTASVAFREASPRALTTLLVFLHAFNGHNNGEIAFGIHAIGAATGNQNHGANSRAVAELIEKGFLECTSDASQTQSKVRTYRITFISTGKARAIASATHEYEFWRPMQKRKFGGARTATQDSDSVAVPAMDVEDSVAVTATPLTESRRFDVGACVAETAPLLDNHSTARPGLETLSQSPVKLRVVDPRVDLDTLRDWAREVLDREGYGGARRLANAAQVPEPALSRFRAGQSLPDRYRARMQEACARYLPHNERATA
jgi:hypothetical protein